MESEVLQKLSEQEVKIDAIWKSVEKTRKMFAITMWVTLGAIVLPLLAGAIIVPIVINSYLSAYQGLI